MSLCIRVTSLSVCKPVGLSVSRSVIISYKVGKSTLSEHLLKSLSPFPKSIGGACEVTSPIRGTLTLEQTTSDIKAGQPHAGISHSHENVRCKFVRNSWSRQIRLFLFIFDDHLSELVFVCEQMRLSWLLEWIQSYWNDEKFCKREQTEDINLIVIKKEIRRVFDLEKPSAFFKFIIK